MTAKQKKYFKLDRLYNSVRASMDAFQTAVFPDGDDEVDMPEELEQIYSLCASVETYMQENLGY